MNGIIKFFDSRDGKRFGFIITDTDAKEIFFHLNDGQKIRPGKSAPEFDQNYSRLDRLPQKGDRVVFSVTQGSKGLKACPWGYEDEYLKAQAVIDNRPFPIMYRILQVFRTVGDGENTQPHVIWSGTNLDDRSLEMHYNPIFDRPGGNGDIDWRKDWQKSEDGGKTWTYCSCPVCYAEKFYSNGRRR